MTTNKKSRCCSTSLLQDNDTADTRNDSDNTSNDTTYNPITSSTISPLKSIQWPTVLMIEILEYLTLSSIESLQYMNKFIHQTICNHLKLLTRFTFDNWCTSNLVLLIACGQLRHVHLVYPSSLESLRIESLKPQIIFKMLTSIVLARNIKSLTGITMINNDWVIFDLVNKYCANPKSIVVHLSLYYRVDLLYRWTPTSSLKSLHITLEYHDYLLLFGLDPYSFEPGVALNKSKLFVSFIRRCVNWNPCPFLSNSQNGTVKKQ